MTVGHVSLKLKFWKFGSWKRVLKDFCEGSFVDCMGVCRFFHRCFFALTFPFFIAPERAEKAHEMEK